VLVAACMPNPPHDPKLCTDGVQNGDETDVDCGGSCTPCADGNRCATAGDCASGVCHDTCAAPTCTDGVQNGSELGIDCGGVCPVTVTGTGCIAGTNGSMVCTDYHGGSTFTVTISWTAAGGNAYVDYVTAYGTNGEDYNSMGVVGGTPINVCTTGPMTVTFDLPFGVGYTYKVWHAFCVRTDACSGCGNDVTTATGGPFGVAPAC